MLTGILCRVSNHVVIDDLGWPLNVISSILILLIYCICHVLSNYLYVINARAYKTANQLWRTFVTLYSVSISWVSW